MRRLVGTLGTLLVCFGLIITGCQKDKQEQPEASKAEESAMKTADETKPAEAEATAGPSATEMAEAAKAAAGVAKAMGAGEAPEVMKKMAEHIKGITKAVKDNMSDCKKAAEAADAYVKANQADVDEFNKHFEKAPEAEKVKLAMQFQALITPVIQEFVTVQIQFTQKCAAEAKVLAKLMKKIQTK